ncbi:MAG: sugar phosphate isomerase/epimerase [Planctomycetota bacterium]|nr:sugar phosphate isomerase/epimerase [Planctomycetota bacterium]
MSMTPALFSVSYAGLWGQHRLDVKSFIAKAAKLGYPAVQLMGKRPHLSVLDTTDRDLAGIREAAGKHNVKICTIAAYTDFTAGRQNPSAHFIPTVEFQVAYVRRLGEMAKALGAGIVRIFTGYDAYSPREDWNICVNAVRECANAMEDLGVACGVQNHHDIGGSFEAFMEFLDDVNHPNCKAMFDPWAPAQHGDDLRKAARIMAPRMVQTTVADYVRLRRFRYAGNLDCFESVPDMFRAVPVGEGFMDYGPFFRGLREGGFSGYVAYEMCSPLRGGGSEENLDRTAAKSLAALKRLIAGRTP